MTTIYSTTKGFTIIESLIAVAILMIAITGPLTAAQRGLAAANIAKDQITANYLAQDAFEYIHNVRNKNIASGAADWLSSILLPGGCTSAAQSCEVDTTVLNPQTAVKKLNSGSINGRLYKFTVSDGNGNNVFGGFRHSTSNGEITPFTRTYFVTQLNANEVLVNVRVSWDTGKYVHTENLTGILTKY